jgi:hypothetical protein
MMLAGIESPSRTMGVFAALAANPEWLDVWDSTGHLLRAGPVAGYMPLGCHNRRRCVDGSCVDSW